MCMDGGDLKYFMKSLCKNYSDFVENGISPVDLRTGTRSYESVYEDFSSGEKRLAKNLYKNVNSKDDHGFPFTPNSIKDKSFIAKRKIPAFKFDAIRSSGKKHGATINDMILTAYFYSLYSTSSTPILLIARSGLAYPIFITSSEAASGKILYPNDKRGSP